MRGKIDCFIPDDDSEYINNNVEQLKESRTVKQVYRLPFDSLISTEMLKEMEHRTDAGYVLICLKRTPLKLGYYALERMLRVIADSNAVMIYADHYSIENGKLIPVPSYLADISQVFF